LAWWSYTHDTRSGNRRHKSTPFFWRRFLIRVSYKSGTRFVWSQKPAPIITLFCSKPESGVHVTEMIIYIFFLFNLHLIAIPGVTIAAPSANSSSTSLSAKSIFGARNFHSRFIWYKKPAPKTGARKWNRFMAPASGACVMSITVGRRILDQMVVGSLPGRVTIR